MSPQILLGLVPVVIGFVTIGERYRTKTATTTEEARKLIEAGFEYVSTHENKTIFRKRRKGRAMYKREQ